MKKIFSCSKYEKVLLIILVLILFIKIIQIHSSYLFKPNKLTIDNITFYCEDYHKYDNDNNSAELFQMTCNLIAKKAKDNPFYNEKKKIRISFCSSHSKFKLFNTMSSTCLAITYSFFNTATIICNKTDFKAQLIEGGAQANNTDSIIDIATHELTHAYITKYAACFNRFLYPVWKEEGYCQYVASSCTYDIENGIHNLLNDVSDNSGSFKYFKYYLAVTYMMNVEHKNFNELIKDKRRINTILNEIKKSDEKTIINWFS